MVKSSRRLNGEVKWWVGTVILVGLALVGMWRETAANTAELRERMVAMETVIPLIYKELGEIKADLREALAK